MAPLQANLPRIGAERTRTAVASVGYERSLTRPDVSERGGLPEAPHGYTAVGLQGAMPRPRSETSADLKGSGQ